jgi:hypothetical protein
MDYEALRKQLPDLKKDAAEWRRKEAEAGARAASIERIAEGIEALLGPLPSPGPRLPGLGDPPENEKLVGVAAVRAVMGERPERIWRAAEIHKQLEARGWLTGDAKFPLRGTEAAINRLWRGGEIERVDKGRYRYKLGEEAENADREPAGSLSYT